MSGKYSSLPRSVTNRRTERINVLFKNNGPVPLRALWLNFKGATQQYAVVQPGRCHAQDTYSTHTWILEDDNGNIWATYNGVHGLSCSSQILTKSSFDGMSRDEPICRQDRHQMSENLRPAWFRTASLSFRSLCGLCASLWACWRFCSSPIPNTE